MLVSELNNIRYEIAALEGVLNNISKDSFAAISLRQKVEELRSFLTENEENPVEEARAVIYFNGGPVVGSQGIESTFLSEALAPFQQLVSARVSKKWKLPVHKKGKIRDLNDSTLFLTGTPRGSFGIELRKLNDVHVSHESHLSEALKEVVTLIDSARDKETFEAAVENSSPREMSAIRKLFGALKKRHAGVTWETGNIHSEFSSEDVDRAYTIISSVRVDVSEVKMIGVFRGALLDSRSYNFTDNSGTPVKGAVSEDLTDDELEEYIKLFVGVECLATFEKVSSSKLEGDEKPQFVLKLLEELL